MILLAIAEIIHRLIQLLVLVVIVQVVLSYFMDPYHSVRRFLDRLVEPMLQPIRRIVPTVGMIDFSPLILIILLQILDAIIGSVLRSLAI
jgi:YggT family protein